MKTIYRIILIALPTILYADPFEDYFNKGIQLVHQEKREQAIEALKEAVQLNPTHAQTYFNIGLIQFAMENYQESKSHLEKALFYNPHYIKAYSTLAQVYAQMNQPDQAIDCYKKIIDLGQATADTHAALARLYKNINNQSAFLDHAHTSLQLNPNNIHVLFDLGYMHNMQGNYDQAVHYYKKVLTLNPTIIDAACNLGQVLRSQGKFEESRTYYQQVINAWPNYFHGLYGYAECCLMLGDLKEGWHAFESRWKRDVDHRHFNEKLWDGSSLQGKTIILRAEYGQGDTLQFIRYAPLLKEQGATVILEAQHTLITLLSNCPYLDRVIPVDDNGANLPPHDFQIPLMSLPLRFNTSLQTIPCSIPYITIPEKVATHWEKEFKNNNSFKIGICWEGSPYYEQFKAPCSKKSIPLAAFAPIAKLPEVNLYSLQKMNGTQQLQSVAPYMKIHDFGSNFDNDNGRFVDTAAVINQMNLIITTDTSIAHLAGALGKQVWVLLPQVADWRWMLNRFDSPWYPSMRLFRQTEVGTWDDPINAIVLELTQIIESQKSIAQKKPISVMTEIQIGELIDKITILEIKNERIKDSNKLKNIQTELNALLKTYKNNISQSLELESLWKALKKINATLWKIEDDIRDKEKAGIFDQEFIDLARAVYYTNDDRCSIKRDINMLTGSRLIEEKSYTNYRTAQ